MMSSLLEEELLALLSPPDFVVVPHENADTQYRRSGLADSNLLSLSAML